LVILIKMAKSVSYEAPHYAVFSNLPSLFGPNIPLSALFSNSLSLCSSLNVRDQASHPYRTTGKIIEPARTVTWNTRLFLRSSLFIIHGVVLFLSDPA
jgi:hypothetical protein